VTNLKAHGVGSCAIQSFGVFIGYAVCVVPGTNTYFKSSFRIEQVQVTPPNVIPFPIFGTAKYGKLPSISFNKNGVNGHPAMLQSTKDGVTHFGLFPDLHTDFLFFRLFPKLPTEYTAGDKDFLASAMRANKLLATPSADASGAYSPYISEETRTHMFRHCPTAPVKGGIYAFA
jgi:hypothetical protein